MGVKLGDSGHRVGAVPGDGQTQLMVGEVTSLEANIDATGSHVVIRGYDKSHRLHRGRKAAPGPQQKDSEIASAIAQEAGLPRLPSTTSVPSSTPTSHSRESPDWDFLVSRAAPRSATTFNSLDGSLEFKQPLAGE